MTDAPNQHTFLSSMTFANSGAVRRNFCACDECDEGGRSAVPPFIREAVREHLRKRRLEQQQPLFDGSKRLNIMQRRELVKREGGFSVWKLCLPLYVQGGDPIVEYRNNHRILFVKSMPKVCCWYLKFVSSFAASFDA